MTLKTRLSHTTHDYLNIKTLYIVLDMNNENANQIVAETVMYMIN